MDDPLFMQVGKGRGNGITETAGLFDGGQPSLVNEFPEVTALNQLHYKEMSSSVLDQVENLNDPWVA